MAAYVGLELLGGAVAARRFLLDRGEDDRVEITTKPPRELRRRAGARLGNALGGRGARITARITARVALGAHGDE